MGVGVALVMGGLTGTTGGYDVVVLLWSIYLTILYKHECRRFNKIE